MTRTWILPSTTTVIVCKLPRLKRASGFWKESLGYFRQNLNSKLDLQPIILFYNTMQILQFKKLCLLTYFKIRYNILQIDIHYWTVEVLTRDREGVPLFCEKRTGSTVTFNFGKLTYFIYIHQVGLPLFLTVIDCNS